MGKEKSKTTSSITRNPRERTVEEFTIGHACVLLESIDASLKELLAFYRPKNVAGFAQPPLTVGPSTQSHGEEGPQLEVPPAAGSEVP